MKLSIIKENNVKIPQNSHIYAICKDLILISIGFGAYTRQYLVKNVYYDGIHLKADANFDFPNIVNSYNRVYETSYKLEDVKMVNVIF